MNITDNTSKTIAMIKLKVLPASKKATRFKIAIIIIAAINIFVVIFNTPKKLDFACTAYFLLHEEQQFTLSHGDGSIVFPSAYAALRDDRTVPLASLIIQQGL